MQHFLSWLTDDAIFSHWDRQLSWRFYTCEQDTQFWIWYTKIGNFHDDFTFLNKWQPFITKIGKFPDDFCLEWDMQFLLGGYVAFSGYPIKKANGTNRCSMLSLVREDKKSENHQKSTYTKFVLWWQIVKLITLWTGCWIHTLTLYAVFFFLSYLMLMLLLSSFCYCYCSLVVTLRICFCFCYHCH